MAVLEPVSYSMYPPKAGKNLTAEQTCRSNKTHKLPSHTHTHTDQNKTCSYKKEVKCYKNNYFKKQLVKHVKKNEAN